MARSSGQVLCLCILCGMLAVAGGSQWDAPVFISNGWNNYDIVFSPGGAAYVVWSMGLAASNDGGKTWTARPLPVGPGTRRNPDLALDASGALYAVYEFLPVGAERLQIVMTKSADGGMTWSAPVFISNTPKHAQWPRIESDSANRLQVLFHDKCDVPANMPPAYPGCTGADFYHLVSTDGGVTWNQQVVASTTGNVWTLDTATDKSGGFYGFWSFCPGPGKPCGVYMYATADAGATWRNAFVGNGNERSGAVDEDGTVHVVYSWFSMNPPPPALPEHRVLYRRGYNGGASWSEPEQLYSGPPKLTGYNPQGWCSVTAAARSQVMAAWQAASGGTTEILARYSPNSGKMWKPAENLSMSEAFSLQPELFAAPSGDVHIVWAEANPPFQLYHRVAAFKGN